MAKIVVFDEENSKQGWDAVFGCLQIGQPETALLRGPVDNLEIPLIAALL
jgi:hypothetical protein